jgi:hypothetical protein
VAQQWHKHDGAVSPLALQLPAEAKVRCQLYDMLVMAE